MMHKISDIWGRVTPEETRARRSMLGSIRSAFLRCPPFDQDSIRAASIEFEHKVKADTALSDAYALLTADQCACVREMTENPPVRFYQYDGGIKEMWIDANVDLLLRLESGELVGPVEQTQLSRPPGTKAV